MSEETIRAAANTLQVINLIWATAILVLSLMAGYRWKVARFYLLGPITYAIHSLIFYGVILAGVHLGAWSSLWSAALRLHSYAFVFGTILAFYLVATHNPPSDDYDG